jgi:hypothetical protein
MHRSPSQTDLDDAAVRKETAEESLGHALIARNREYRAVGTARWCRARRAEGLIPRSGDDAA